MTAPTPEQMRALADGGEEVAGLLEDYSWEDVSGHPPATINELSAALRAAADREDAVRRERDAIARLPRGDSFSRDSILATFDGILTADTAPQEDRDE